MDGMLLLARHRSCRWLCLGTQVLHSQHYTRMIVTVVLSSIDLHLVALVFNIIYKILRGIRYA